MDFTLRRADGSERKVGGYKFAEAPAEAKRFEASLERLPPRMSQLDAIAQADGKVSEGEDSLIVEAPVSALEGVSESDAKLLEQASDEQLDYVAVALDLGTSPFEHTGIQTVARRVIARAYGEL